MPASPNAVSSDADRSDSIHFVEPFPFVDAPSAAWDRMTDAVCRLSRTTIITQSDTLLVAECRSRIFRFVDDLELRLEVEKQQIAVRSASRFGYSDFGVNRRRVERLRRLFDP